MRDTIMVLTCTCLWWGWTYPQDTDSPPNSAPSSIPSHADVQIVYTDEFMKVIEKYGITDDDIMYVTNKYNEGKQPTIKKIVKDKETGDEKVCNFSIERVHLPCKILLQLSIHLLFFFKRRKND